MFPKNVERPMFDTILDFLTESPSPEQIVAYNPTEALQNRLSELLAKNKQVSLTLEEQEELEEYLRMNRFMNRLKIKARQKLKG